MKKIIGVLLGITVCLFFFVSLSLAHDLIATDPPYNCTSTQTNCQQCHVGMTNPLHNFVWAAKTPTTTWHAQHREFANIVCATCHTGAVDSCGAALVETKNCKICHNPTPPTLPDPNSPPPATVTPPAVSLPCDWVNNHKTADRGVNCSTGSCHGDCATVIGLSSFTAVPDNRKVVIEWTTETEINNAGFNLYRSESVDGAYVKINPVLIPAKGVGTSGASYQYEDNNVKNRNTYYYKLEDLDTSGISTMHGPAVATPRRVGVR